MLETTYNKNKKYEDMPLITINNEEKPLEKNNKWKLPSDVITFWVTSAILIGLIFLSYFLKFGAYNFFKWGSFSNLRKEQYSLNGYLINTPGCRIPDMHVYDASVTKFIFKPDDLLCNKRGNKGRPALFKSNLTSLFVITKYLFYYNVTNFTDLNCCYKEFWRAKPNKNQNDNGTVYSSRCIPINADAVRIDREFVKVICTNKKKQKLYEDFFAFVPLIKKNKGRSSKKGKPNILIIGLDGISRLNLHRQLPKTSKYLTKKLRAIELLGYNIVGENTFKNIIPVLTGMSSSELEDTCWPSHKHHFDKCPFLWNYFSQNNYLTAMGEDCSGISIFNYEKNGFFKKPTDYYYNSFNGEMERAIGGIYHTDLFENCLQCGGSKEIYKITLDYIKKFVLTMRLKSVPYFGFFWGNALSHDHLNRPALGDETYYKFFRSLKRNGHFNNTILIFMSDHGIRWGGIRETYQGRMEERLPFVFIKFPNWFNHDHAIAIKNLKRNKRRLTTPFDLHETLKDLSDLNSFTKSRKILHFARGYSLFKEIPIYRTCEDAEIASHWCTCQESDDIDTDDFKIVAAAKFAIHDMNSQLKDYAQCATLVLDSIINARVSFHDREYFSRKNIIQDYTIMLKTVPGYGIFEATVRDKGRRYIDIDQEKEISDEEQWEYYSITGTISRISIYGNQSHCINNFHLKGYCYCKSQF